MPHENTLDLAEEGFLVKCDDKPLELSSELLVGSIVWAGSDYVRYELAFPIIRFLDVLPAASGAHSPVITKLSASA